MSLSTLSPSSLIPRNLGHETFLFVSIGHNAWVETLVVEKATTQVAMQEEQNTYAAMGNAVDALCHALDFRQVDPEPSSLVALTRGRLVRIHERAQTLATDVLRHGVW